MGFLHSVREMYKHCPVQRQKPHALRACVLPLQAPVSSLASPWYENRTVFICPLHGLHLACSFSSFLIVLSCSDSYYGTVKLCAVESTLYLICYAVQRSKRNSSMTDPCQILKTLHKLLTRPGTIYSQRNTKQDPVCLWHIVKIRSSRFLQLRKASMGSGNCSCVCQAMLNQLFPPHYSFGLNRQQRKYNPWQQKERCLSAFGWLEVNGHPSMPPVSKNPPPPKANPRP